jgi:dual specificity phosphatase 3
MEMPVRPIPRPLAANVSFVTARLAVGGDLSPRAAVALAQLDELVDLGVTHIVDVRLEWSDEEFVAEHAPQVGYLHHGMDDAGQRVAGEWFDTGVEFVLEAMTTSPDAVVLTHCHMGINRGPSLGFAVLLALGWDPVDALDALRTARPIAQIDYAGDALRWHHRAVGIAAAELARDLRRLAAWRQRNDLDVAGITRGLRGGLAG